MAQKTHIVNLTGTGQVVFPVQLGQGKIPFVVGSFFIINNTNATLYVSRSVVNPGASQSDFTVPPRASVPAYGWDADTLYVGSDGTAVLATDSLTIQMTEDRAPFGASAIPLVSSQVRRVQTGSVTITINNGEFPLKAGTAAITGVNILKSACFYNGFVVTASSDNTLTPDIQARVQLSASSVVTGEVSVVGLAPSPITYTVVIYFTVLELV